MSALQNKVDDAISLLRSFEPLGDSYYLCYSGGKDSDAIRILATLAGVRFEIHHNLTTVDAPETMAYIKTIPDIIIDKARYNDGSAKTMWNLIPRKRLPPTRIVRWCCSELKEAGGKGRLKITGVRWAESSNRKNNSDSINIVGKPVSSVKRLVSLGIPYRLNRFGSPILSASSGDNDSIRSKNDFVHQCYKDRSITINPIISWSDSDVWKLLKYYGCSGNPLYYSGCSRIGCIGCPLSGSVNQKNDFARYPKYKQNYIAAFDRLLSANPGKYTWNSGYELFQWWIGDNPDQLALFSDDDLLSIF